MVPPTSLRPSRSGALVLQVEVHWSTDIGASLKVERRKDRQQGLRSKHSRALVLTGGQVVDPKSLSSCLHDAPYRGLERSTGFPPTHGGLRHHSQTRGARGANAQHNPSWLEDLPDAAVVDLRKGFSPRRTLAVAFQHYAARTNRDKPNEHNWVHLDLRRSCAQSSLWSAPLRVDGTWYCTLRPRFCFKAEFCIRAAVLSYPFQRLWPPSRTGT